MSDPDPPKESTAASDIAERFVPETMKGQLVEAEHLARYMWASRLCRGRRTLDVGCGAGYGAELLNDAGASEVRAIDNSNVALELARANVSSGVVCELGDARDLAFPDDSFDLVVCFELIEHVDEQQQVLDELARVLRPDGLLLLSSPNRDRYVPGNPHHRHELTRTELQDLLRTRFASSRILSQHVMLASAIGWAQEPSLSGPHVHRATEPGEEDELYLIAMAGSELPPDPTSVICVTQFAEPRAWLEHIDGQQRHIDRMTRRQQELEGVASDGIEALERLAHAEGELSELTVARRILESELLSVKASREREAARLTLEISDLKDQLSQITNSRSWRLIRTMRHARATLRSR